MPYRSTFFTTQTNPDGSYDRVYSAEDFVRRFEKSFSNGVIIDGEISTELEVTKVSGSMSVSVDLGSAVINGYDFEVYAVPLQLTHEAADTSYSRIDRIVLELNLTEAVRAIIPKILKGTPAASPTEPNLTRTESIYQISLAKVTIPANASSLNAATLVDERSLESVCGISYIRSGMTDLEEKVSNSITARKATGTSTTYQVNTNGRFEQIEGRLLTFIPSFTNLGSCSVSIDSQTALPIKDIDIDGNAVDPLPNRIRLNQAVTGYIDSVNNFFVLAPKGGGEKVINEEIITGTLLSDIEEGETAYANIGFSLSNGDGFNNPPLGQGSISATEDGLYLAVGSNSSSQGLIIYKLIDGEYIKLSDPIYMPTAVTSVAISRTGKYLAASSNAAAEDKLVIYKRNGDVFTRINNPNNMPTLHGKLAFNYQENHLAIGGTEYIRVYKLVEEVATNIYSTTYSCRGLCYNKEGTMLAALYFSSYYGLQIYDISNDSYSVRNVVPPTSSTQFSDVKFTNDGRFIFLSKLVSPYIEWYEVIGSVLTKMSNPDVLPTDAISRVAINKKDNILITEGTNEGGRVVYKVTRKTLKKVSNWTLNYTGAINELAFVNNDKWLVKGRTSSPYLVRYNTLFSAQIGKASNQIDVGEKLGYTLQAGHTGDSIKMKSIFNA